VSRLNAAQWSAYWRSGAVTTFQDIFSGNYDRDVADFWRECFAGLDSGARMVDLACGNGALALLAAAWRRDQGAQFEIDAVDYAEIAPPPDPDNRALAEGIGFYAGRRLESTGLNEGAYQLAVSQFGLEYGETESALAEVNRILAATGATLAVICHHEGSDIVKQGRQGLEQQALCAASPLPELVRRLQTRLEQVQREGRDPAKDRACERLRDKFNRATTALHSAAEQQANPAHLLYFIRGCLAPFDAANMQRMPLTRRLAMIDQLLAACQSFELRMQDLVSAALSEEDLARWDGILRGYGFTPQRCEPFTLEGKLFGQLLVYRR